MDKQEVINEIEKIDYQNLKYNSPERMLSEQKQLFIDIIDKLDEPQKVKVPAFVAEWFEKHKHRLGYSIWKLVGESHKSYTTNKLDMRHWILQEPNNPIETLIRMQDGYEVEESKWAVKRADSDYVTSFNQSLLNTNIDVTSSLDCVSYYKFTDLKKAEAVATLVDGSVEEV